MQKKLSNLKNQYVRLMEKAECATGRKEAVKHFHNASKVADEIKLLSRGNKAAAAATALLLSACANTPSKPPGLVLSHQPLRPCHVRGASRVCLTKSENANVDCAMWIASKHS